MSMLFEPVFWSIFMLFSVTNPMPLNTWLSASLVRRLLKQDQPPATTRIPPKPAIPSPQLPPPQYRTWTVLWSWWSNINIYGRLVNENSVVFVCSFFYSFSFMYWKIDSRSVCSLISHTLDLVGFLVFFT